MSVKSNITPFSESLPKAQETEKAVASLLGVVGRRVVQGGRDCRMDLATYGCDGWPTTVEVKDETAQANTGNICVELCQGKPSRYSGILTSEAMVTIHVLGNMAAIYRTVQMWLYIYQGLHGKPSYLNVISFPGSDNHNRGVLIPINKMTEFDWFDFRPFRLIEDSHVWRGGAK